MGQKVNPHGLRVGVIKDWDSRWFATDKKEFGNLLLEDHNIRKFLKKRLYSAGVARIEIERSANKIKMDLHVAKPGVVIGRAGAGIEALKVELEKMTKKSIIVNIVEVRSTDKNAQLVAENIALAIERRVAFRRAMKQAIQRAMKSGAKGIKVSASGRLGGAEMARTEGYSEGNVPLQTLRADIDYGFAEADTTYGKIGIKVWVCNGEILPTRDGVNPREESRKSDRRDNKRDNRRNDRRGNDNRNYRGNDNRGNDNRGNYRGQKPQGNSSRPQGNSSRPQGGSRPQGTENKGN
ncbi:30S ribosomal protein S3 [Clostridioides sp. ES-S-0049-02]|uniref:30S ribosomal protein S3 n=1 Tax=Clostridioides sp. ES-S-0049-02 TaxID=2770778 RepID=UPI001D10CB2D|nr:30S ribosomal protein S3 [Clostridioides sp. ES-S-0049-02]